MSYTPKCLLILLCYINVVYVLSPPRLHFSQLFNIFPVWHMMFFLLKYSSFLLFSLCSIWKISLFLFYNPCKTCLLWEYTLCIQVDDLWFVSISYFGNTCKITLIAFLSQWFTCIYSISISFLERKQCFIFIFLPLEFSMVSDTNYDSINVTEFNWHKVNQGSHTYLKLYCLCKILWDC